MDFMKPETYLAPGELAAIDQWEMTVKKHVEECVEMMRDIEKNSGPQSLSVWSVLLLSAVDPDRLSTILAYFLLKEARRAPTEA